MQILFVDSDPSHLQCRMGSDFGCPAQSNDQLKNVLMEKCSHTGPSMQGCESESPEHEPNGSGPSG